MSRSRAARCSSPELRWDRSGRPSNLLLSGMGGAVMRPRAAHPHGLNGGE